MALGHKKQSQQTQSQEKQAMQEPINKFWKEIPLEDMDHEQWESLCDGCGRCCLKKIIFEDTGEIVFTRVVCRFLDQLTCRCACYEQRSSINNECTVITAKNLAENIHLLPDTCSYRIIHEGRDLPWWHPLVSGDPDWVHPACISIRNHLVGEDEIRTEDLENYIVDWVNN